MTIKNTFLVIGLAFACVLAHAEKVLLESKNCYLCHSIDKKIVGPAFKDVAVKYKNDQEAQERLARKITQGGAGVWGDVAMPANSQVNSEEAKRLAMWVLHQK